MKRLRRVSGPLGRRRSQEAAIFELIQTDAAFAEHAARVWRDITGKDGIEGVLMVHGKPVMPSDQRRTAKALK